MDDKLTDQQIELEEGAPNQTTTDVNRQKFFTEFGVEQNLEKSSAELEKMDNVRSPARQQSADSQKYTTEFGAEEYPALSKEGRSIEDLSEDELREASKNINNF